MILQHTAAHWTFHRCHSFTLPQPHTHLSPIPSFFCLLCFYTSRKLSTANDKWWILPVYNLLLWSYFIHPNPPPAHHKCEWTRPLQQLYGSRHFLQFPHWKVSTKSLYTRVCEKLPKMGESETSVAAKESASGLWASQDENSCLFGGQKSRQRWSNHIHNKFINQTFSHWEKFFVIALKLWTCSFYLHSQ